jgi:hypothetical protein
MHRDELLRHAAKHLADPSAAASFVAGLDAASRRELSRALAGVALKADLRVLVEEVSCKRLSDLRDLVLERQRGGKRRGPNSRRRRRNPVHQGPPYWDTGTPHACCSHAVRDAECDCCQGRCPWHAATHACCRHASTVDGCACCARTCPNAGLAFGGPGSLQDLAPRVPSIFRDALYRFGAGVVASSILDRVVPRQPPPT